MRSWLLALGALFFLGCSPEPATPPPARDVRAAGELRVATRIDALSYREGADGKPSGFEHDLLVALGARMGLPVHFHVYPDAIRALDAVLKGEADLAAAGLNRNDRLPIAWGKSIREVDFVIAGREDGPAIGSERDLSGSTVGVRRGTPPADALEDIQHRVANLKIRHPKSGGDPRLLEMVAKGELDLAATDRVQFSLAANFFPNLTIALPLSIKSNIAWALPQGTPKEVLDAVDSFITEARNNGTVARIADRYFGHIRRLDQDDITTFLARVQNRLPPFRRHFQDAQSITGIDWRLLAALAYQESQWDPLATSPTGVRGIMMLTEDTADRLGVYDRLDPRSAIIGGARYFALLRDQLPGEVPDPDRNWMTIAAYNLGMGHFNGARQIALSLKKDVTAWLDMKQVLPLMSKPDFAARLKSGPRPGGEAVTTAENVRNYYEILSRFEAPYLAPTEPNKFKLPPLRLGARPKRATEVVDSTQVAPEGGQGLRLPNQEALPTPSD